MRAGVRAQKRPPRAAGRASDKKGKVPQAPGRRKGPAPPRLPGSGRAPLQQPRGFASVCANAAPALCRQAWQTPPGSFALRAGPEHGHQRLSARCKTPLVLLPHLSGPAEHRMPRPLAFLKNAAAGAGAEYGACGISGPCNFPKARCLTLARHAAPAVRPICRRVHGCGVQRARPCKKRGGGIK